MHSFRGMFGCCKLNRTFRGYVMLLPDHLENKIGYLAQTIQGMKESTGQIRTFGRPGVREAFCRVRG